MKQDFKNEEYIGRLNQFEMNQGKMKNILINSNGNHILLFLTKINFNLFLMKIGNLFSHDDSEFPKPKRLKSSNKVS